MSAPSAIYVRVPSDLLREFDEVAQAHGMSRSEAIRESMRLFIKYSRAPTVKKVRGIVEGTKISVEKLEKLVRLG